VLNGRNGQQKRLTSLGEKDKVGGGRKKGWESEKERERNGEKEEKGHIIKGKKREREGEKKGKWERNRKKRG